MSSTCSQPVKRRRTNYTNTLAKMEISQDNTIMGMDLLADAIVRSVFEYLPPSYLLIAGVCHRFRTIYKEIAKKTSAEHLVQSVAGARLFVEAGDPKGLFMPTPKSADGYPMCRTEFVCDTASAYGNIRVLKWMQERGYTFDETLICQAAALNGHLSALKWLCKQNAPWSDETSISAAENGHLEVLQWAVHNGCPFCWHLCVQAARENRHVEVVKWLHLHQTVLLALTVL